MAAYTNYIQVFLERPLFHLSSGIHSIITFGILSSGYLYMTFQLQNLIVLPYTYSKYTYFQNLYFITKLCIVMWCVHHITRHNTPIYSILSTAPQLSISQKVLGTLPEDGNVMPKHV
jgi:hypothetical protein